MSTKIIYLLPYYLKLFPKVSSSHVRNYARLITSDKIVNLDKHTLTGRLMLYLRPEKTEDDTKTEIISNDVINALRTRNLSLKCFSNNDLIALISSLENRDLVRSDREFYKLLKAFDEECCVREVTTREMFSLLDAFMDLVPNRMTELKFYEFAIDYLQSRKAFLSERDYMRLLFYIALMKKTIKSQKMLRDTLSILKKDNIKQMSIEDLCVIANATFKTSTKISNKNILNKIKNYLNDNLMLLKDPAIFVTLIKSLRHNRYCDEDLLATITYGIFFNKSFEFYTFRTYCHILALYSDNLYYDEELLKFLSEKCVNELKQNQKSPDVIEVVRPKDIIRLLWGLSNLNCTFIERPDISDTIVPKVIEFINFSKFDISSIIDVMLYLWILNYKCYELVPYILERKNQLEKVPDGSNTKQRLNQLLTYIYYEDQVLFRKLDMRPKGKTSFVLAQHLKIRPYLRQIFHKLEKIGNGKNMKFEVNYQIPYTNILGITGYRKNIYKAVNIEVLDDFSTLKNTNSKPSGLMQMKLRILDGFEEALIVVRQDEISELTDAELEEFLLDELNLVC